MFYPFYLETDKGEKSFNSASSADSVRDKKIREILKIRVPNSERITRSLLKQSVDPVNLLYRLND